MVHAQTEYAPITPENADTVGAINDLQVAIGFNGQDSPATLAFSPTNSNELAVGFQNGEIGIISNVTDEQYQILRWAAHTGATYDIAYSSDGRYLFSVGPDGRVLQWNAEAGALHQVIEDQDIGAFSVVVHPNQPIIAVGYNEGIVRMFDYETGEKLLTLRSYEAGVIDVDFHENGEFFGLAHRNWAIIVYEYRDLYSEEIYLYETLYMGELAEFEFQPDVFQEPPLFYIVSLVTGISNFQSVQSIDIWRRRPIDPFYNEYESNSEITYPAAMDYNSGGSLIVAGGKVSAAGGGCNAVACAVEIMHGVNGKETNLTVINTLELHEVWMTDIVFSEDDRYIATAAVDGKIIISAAHR